MLLRTAGDLSFSPILYHAARWNTPSTPAIGLRIESLSVMSPLWTRTPIRVRSPAFAGSRAIASTAWPASRSCRASRVPMNPVAPVTKYRMGPLRRPRPE